MNMTDINKPAAGAPVRAEKAKVEKHNPHAGRAGLVTIEMLNAILSQNLVALKAKIDAGANTNFVFGETYRCKEGYTPLMAALQVGNMDVCRQLLNSGANPNFINSVGDAVVFWGIDSGVEAILLLHEFGADLDMRTDKDWTPLQYARAVGKYGHPSNKGVYPEDVLRSLGASEYGTQPAAKRARSPRVSYNASGPTKQGPGQQDSDEDEDDDAAGALDDLGGRSSSRGGGPGLSLGLGPPSSSMPPPAGGSSTRAKEAAPAVTPVQAALANIMSQAAAHRGPAGGASTSGGGAGSSAGEQEGDGGAGRAGRAGRAGGASGASETESEGEETAGGGGGCAPGKDLKLEVGGAGGTEGAAAGGEKAAPVAPMRVGALSLGAGFLGR